MWRQVVAQSPADNAAENDVVRYDLGWKALNTLLKSGRSLSGHERNCCFLNTAGQGRFADVSAAAAIDFDDDGRVVAPTDWDGDGDLDFWIANRTGPQVRFLRNDHGQRFRSVAFRLEGVECNRDAIGARVEVHVAGDDVAPVRAKTVRAGEGYLAQSSRWLHFGLGAAGEVEKVVVRWPGGGEETLAGVSAGGRYSVRQGEGRAVVWPAPERQPALAPQPIEAPVPTDRTRVVLIAPVPMPSLSYTSADGAAAEIAPGDGRARLINLWATWCAPCLEELGEWAEHRSAIEASGVEIVAVNVDEPEEDPVAQRAQIAAVLAKTGFAATSGYGGSQLVELLDAVQRAMIYLQRPMPVPTSFLIDGGGNLRVIYKGTVSADQLIADAALLDATPEEVVAASVPYEGKWLGRPAGASPNQIAVKFVEGGFMRETEDYVRKLIANPGSHPLFQPVDAAVLLGALLVDQGRLEESAQAFEAAVQADPDYRRAQIELAAVYAKLGRHPEAAGLYERALERRQDDPDLWFQLGVALLNSGQSEPGVEALARSIELRPSASAYYNTGNALIGLGDVPGAVAAYQDAVALDPDLVPAANNLAWLLATNADGSLRDGQRAVELAERVCGDAANRSPSHLDTLSVAYAEAGRFDEAIRAADEAIRGAKAEGDLAMARAIQKRKSSFLEGVPYRDGAGS